MSVVAKYTYVHKIVAGLLTRPLGQSRLVLIGGETFPFFRGTFQESHRIPREAVKVFYRAQFRTKPTLLVNTILIYLTCSGHLTWEIDPTLNDIFDGNFFKNTRIKIC